MKNKRIILASASPRRKELLVQIGLTFEIRPSTAEEVIQGSEPTEAVKNLAACKADDIFRKLSSREKGKALVIGADTVVVLDGIIMGKPADEEDARRMLLALQGRSHQVYTGVKVIWQEEDAAESIKEKVFYEETVVELYPMTEEEIENYIASKESMDKAGAYAVQGGFAAYIKGISGDYNNVVGLPIGRLYQEIKDI